MLLLHMELYLEFTLFQVPAYVANMQRQRRAPKRPIPTLRKHILLRLTPFIQPNSLCFPLHLLHMFLAPNIHITNRQANTKQTLEVGEGVTPGENDAG